MSETSLSVLLGGEPVGTLTHDRGASRFEYDGAWRESVNAIPLSLSMPLAGRAHGPEVVEPFLAGLLPDDRDILERWGRRFGVSPRNPFALLAHMGEDCAGAVQFVRAERLDVLRDETAWDVEPIDPSEIAERLRALASDRSAWHVPSAVGQFSLAGAQPKLALFHRDDAWFVPSGRAPTTHILKPPVPGFDGHVENEHMCLALARELGLPAASSRVERFEDQVAIVVRRFDRVDLGGDPLPGRETDVANLDQVATRWPVVRLHQEDACQALGVPPALKYEADGGPGPPELVNLLRAHSSRPAEDVSTFVDALALNWLIAGTDAHAKNYSLLHGGGGRVRLAPLYDVASFLPYADFDPQRVKLAMKVGSKYRIRDVSARTWRKLAQVLSLDEDETLERVRALACALPEAAARVEERARAAGLSHPIVGRLAALFGEHAAQCLSRLRDANPDAG